MIVGEAPGENEILKNEPFVGASGMELTRMLHEAGISRSECFITNVVRERPAGNDISNFIAFKKNARTAAHVSLRDKWVLPVVREGYELLKKEIELCKPNVIIACGNVSLWALTGQWGIGNWRGSLMQTDQILFADGTRPKVVPVQHPAAILRVWEDRATAVHDLRRAASQAGTRELRKPEWKFQIRSSLESTLATLDYLQGLVDSTATKLSVDIETRAGHISCIGIAWSRTEAICIPLMESGKPEGHWPLEAEAEIVFRLMQLLTHANARVIGQNFLYDAQYFYRHLHFIPNFFCDTLLSQHAMFSDSEKGLGYLSSMYCEYHRYWKDDGKTWNATTGEEQLWVYNCEDCVRTLEIHEEQQKVVEQLNLREVHDFQQSLFWPVLETMNRGLRIDARRKLDFGMTLQNEIASREQWFLDVLGHPLNPRSGKQMQELFYGDLRQRVILNRKTKQPTMDDSALTLIGEREPLLRPLLDKIAEYRSLGVFLSTFVNARADVDGRMRCSFNPGGTVTYRFSSSRNAFDSGMNLQNIPGEDNGGNELELPNIRTLFTPDIGYTFFDIDLDSADLRIVVYESDCKEMKAMFAEKKKPYLEVAREHHKNPNIGKDHPAYKLFKSFCHGSNYLGGAAELARRLGLHVHEAERLQKWYFGKFPEIKAWQERIKAQVNTRRYVENAYGYRKYIFRRIDGNVYNEAIAWIPQSSVGILINKGYARIYKEFREAQVLLQVHDSLAGQFPSSMGENGSRRIVELCTNPIPYSDPLIIPVGIKTSDKSWGDCK